MLKNEEIKKIEDFVYLKPRSVQEIAEYIKKNWRTADRYVEEIISEYGTIDKRIFREGTRGALKIVYGASVEKRKNSVFQEELYERIMTGKTKNDFSAFDMFQFIPDKNKRAIIERGIDENTTNLKELKIILEGAKKQVLIFSGNLSFINLKKGSFDMGKILEELIKRGTSVKIICNVDLTGKENLEKIMSLNFKNTKDLIEIRHRTQPLRAIIVDDNVMRLKEVKEPTGKIKELDKKIFIFYTIKDKDWVSWTKGIFWKMFSRSLGSEGRLKELEKIKINTF